MGEEGEGEGEAGEVGAKEAEGRGEGDFVRGSENLRPWTENGGKRLGKFR